MIKYQANHIPFQVSNTKERKINESIRGTVDYDKPTKVTLRLHHADPRLKCRSDYKQKV